MGRIKQVAEQIIVLLSTKNYPLLLHTYLVVGPNEYNIHIYSNGNLYGILIIDDGIELILTPSNNFIPGKFILSKDTKNASIKLEDNELHIDDSMISLPIYAD
jgi:hypothetical protein